MSNQFDLLLKTVIDSQPEETYVKLIHTLPIDEIHDEDIKKLIAGLYQSPVLSHKITGSILNAVFSERKATFLMSKKILDELIKNDSNIRRNTINSESFKKLTEYFAKIDFFKVIKDGSSKKLASVIKLNNQILLDKFYTIVGRAFVEAQETRVLDVFDKRSQEKSQGKSQEKSYVIDHVNDHVSEIVFENVIGIENQTARPEVGSDLRKNPVLAHKASTSTPPEVYVTLPVTSSAPDSSTIPPRLRTSPSVEKIIAPTPDYRVYKESILIKTPAQRKADAQESYDAMSPEKKLLQDDAEDFLREIMAQQERKNGDMSIDDFLGE